LLAEQFFLFSMVVGWVKFGLSRLVSRYSYNIIICFVLEKTNSCFSIYPVRPVRIHSAVPLAPESLVIQLGVYLKYFMTIVWKDRPFDNLNHHWSSFKSSVALKWNHLSLVCRVDTPSAVSVWPRLLLWPLPVSSVEPNGIPQVRIVSSRYSYFNSLYTK